MIDIINSKLLSRLILCHSLHDKLVELKKD